MHEPNIELSQHNADIKTIAITTNLVVANLLDRKLYFNLLHQRFFFCYYFCFKGGLIGDNSIVIITN